MPRSANQPFPSVPGTYVLVFGLPHALTVTAGRLGPVTIPPGSALYVGSAHGPGGLHARLARHLRAEKKPHWHVDALAAHALIDEVWWADSAERLECGWAAVLHGLPYVAQPAPGFGASDCGCVAHLFSLPNEAREGAWAALGRPHRQTIED